MYARDIPRLPESVSREVFVNTLFDIGLLYQCSCDTLLSAVTIGDAFVSHKFSIPPHRLIANPLLTPDKADILNQPLPQTYSIDLAHVSLCISSSIHEESCYSIDDASRDLDNIIVYKLQWEVCLMFKFCIPTPKIVKLLAILGYGLTWDLSKDIALDKSLLYSNPYALLLGVKLLGRNVSANTKRRYRLFKECFLQISSDYELDISDLLLSYSNLRRKSITA